MLKIEEKLFSLSEIKTRLNLIEVLLVCIMVWNFFKCPVLFRGGGELGREWYLEGKLQNKHKSFEVRLCLLGLSLHRNQTETLSTQARVCYGPCSSSTSYTLKSNNKRNTVSRFSSLSENVQPFADMKQRQHIHEPNRPTIRTITVLPSL